jgi:succinate-acetate transporter protein
MPPGEGGIKEALMEAATIQRDGREAAVRPAEVPHTGWKPAYPGPLGLAAFAMTTFVLSVFNANLVNEKGVPVVLGLALVYGGIVQLIAGIWEFRTGNTFGAVAFCSFGAFWISFWALNVFYAKQVGGNAGHAVGVYLWAWAIFTTYMAVAELCCSCSYCWRRRSSCWRSARTGGTRRSPTGAATWVSLPRRLHGTRRLRRS